MVSDSFMGALWIHCPVMGVAVRIERSNLGLRDLSKVCSEVLVCYLAEIEYVFMHIYLVLTGSPLRNSVKRYNTYLSVLTLCSDVDHTLVIQIHRE